MKRATCKRRERAEAIDRAPHAKAIYARAKAERKKERENREYKKKNTDRRKERNREMPQCRLAFASACMSVCLYKRRSAVFLERSG